MSSLAAPADAHSELDHAGADADGGPPLSLLDLPDGVVAHALQCLGLRGAARARAVCRTFRELIDGLEWAELEVVLESRPNLQLDPPFDGTDPRVALLERLTERVASGALRLAGGSALWLGCVQFDLYGRLRAAQLAAATARFIAACTSRGLRRLALGGFRALTPFVLTQDELEPGQAPGPGRHDATAVRHLLVTPHSHPGEAAEYPFRPYLGPEILLAMLRPFAALESLCSPHIDIDAAAGEALAGALPGLRHVRLGSRDEDFLPRLGSLPLERLELHLPPGPALACGLVELSAAPAARTLRSLAALRPGRARESFPFAAGQLRALAAFAALEELDLTLVLVPGARGRPEDVAALAELRRLRALRVVVARGQRAAVEGLRLALERGLCALRSLELLLEIDEPGGEAARGALFAAAGGRLAALNLRSTHALPPGEARALAGLAARPVLRIGHVARCEADLAGYRELEGYPALEALIVEVPASLEAAARAAVAPFPEADVLVIAPPVGPSPTGSGSPAPLPSSFI